MFIVGLEIKSQQSNLHLPRLLAVLVMLRVRLLSPSVSAVQAAVMDHNTIKLNTDTHTEHIRTSAW